MASSVIVRVTFRVTVRVGVGDKASIHDDAALEAWRQMKTDA